MTPTLNIWINSLSNAEYPILRHGTDEEKTSLVYLLTPQLRPMERLATDGGFFLSQLAVELKVTDDEIFLYYVINQDARIVRLGPSVAFEHDATLDALVKWVAETKEEAKGIMQRYMESRSEKIADTRRGENRRAGRELR